MRVRETKAAALVGGLGEYLNSDAERGMRRSFGLQSGAVLSDEGAYSKDYDKVIIGLETEHGLVDPGLIAFH